MIAYNFGYLKINEPIKVRMGEIIETSIGRLIFNDILPKNFHFINETFNKKELQKPSLN